MNPHQSNERLKTISARNAKPAHRGYAPTMRTGFWAQGSRASAQRPNWTVIVGGITALFLTLNATSAQSNAAGDAFLSALGLKRGQLSQLKSGVLVESLPVDHPKRENALVGVVRVNSTSDELLKHGTQIWQALMDSPTISGEYDPNRGDQSFAALALPSDDFELLEECRTGQCRFKLDERGIQTAQGIDWSKPEAEQVFLAEYQSQLAEIMSVYQEKGTAGLTKYADKPKATERAETVRDLEAGAQAWLQFYPILAQRLTDHPEESADDLAERFQWKIASVGLRDTLVLEHVVFAKTGDVPGFGNAIAIRTLYASHYLEARVQIAMIVEGTTLFGVPGRFLFMMERVRFDEDLGFLNRKLLARALRGRTRERLKEVESAIAKQGQ